MLQPQDDSWAAIVYESRHGTAARLGTAALIDRFRLLTCLHVIPNGQLHTQVWVAFPKSQGLKHRDRWPATISNTAPDLDVAVLKLAEGLPHGIAMPTLRCPPPHAMRDKRWWAFGYAGSRRGNSAYGHVGESLGDGCIRLDADPGAIYRLQEGFSGGGVWSPDFEAVVGIVVTADEYGNGEAVTLHQIDLCLPREGLQELTRWTASEAGETALAAWGWTLDRDPEGVRHWRPKGRGVSADSERGFRFRGRREALTAIKGWLDRKHSNRRVLVVTGSPGAGKSAVLGRIVTTADLDAAAALPRNDQAVRASLGSVACAVHAKGKTALEVAAEIARAASSALPDQLEDFAPALRAALTRAGGRRFNVVIDALDEATNPEQAKKIISKVILPLAETCADVGAQVVCGSRRSVGDVDLLMAFADSIEKLDLDDSSLFSDYDLVAYTLATLRLEGDEREGNPYANEAIARPVAARIAELSDRNFLVASLIARAHGLYDLRAANPASIRFTASVDAAMREYLQRLRPVTGISAEAVLTALAFAEAPGLPLELWQAAVQTLGFGHLTSNVLAQFARTPAASYLVETGSEDGVTVFRLFHQALNDALLHNRERVASFIEDQKAITVAFTAIGSQRAWDDVPGYLLRSLPMHAAAANMIDDLLMDDAYLRRADLRRLIPIADRATSTSAYQRSRLLRLTPRAISADPVTRTAMFSVTEVLENLGQSYTTSHFPAPYRATWAEARPHTERSVLEGHTGCVTGVCTFTEEGRTLLATGGSDGTLRIWDPATGAENMVLHIHLGWVNAVCAFTLDGRTFIASGGDDSAVRIWDPSTGAKRSVEWSHRSWINAVCAFTMHGRTMLASGSGDGTLRIWDPATGTGNGIMHGSGSINALCAFSEASRTLLASGSSDGTLRIWDPATGTETGIMHSSGTKVLSLCAFTSQGRTLLASGGDDGAARIWDPSTGTEHGVMHGSGSKVLSLCAFTSQGRTLLASGDDDGAARIWDPESNTKRAARSGSGFGVRALCTFGVHDRTLLASGGDDGAARIWDPSTGAEHAVVHSHRGGINALCALARDGHTLLASGGGDGAAHIWDASTGAEHEVVHSHRDGINALCAFAEDGRVLLAAGGRDNTVRFWDLAAGTENTALRVGTFGIRALHAFILHNQTFIASGGGDGALRIWNPKSHGRQAILHRHTDGVRCLCSFMLSSQILLASGSDDRTVRIWDPAQGTEYAVLSGHTDSVRAVCAFELDNRTLLASGSDDRTVRIWDPMTRSVLLVVPVHYRVRAISSYSDMLIVAITAGLLALRIDSP